MARLGGLVSQAIRRYVHRNKSEDFISLNFCLKNRNLHNLLGSVKAFTKLKTAPGKLYELTSPAALPRNVFPPTMPVMQAQLMKSLPMMVRTWSSQAATAFPVAAKVAAERVSQSAAVKSFVNGGPKAQKAVSWWLFGCSGWVFSMVVLGGVTRLTRSGLSMTDWKFTGRLPPLNEAEWNLEFEKYKKSPEYKRVNLGMELQDFKFIYWMEYAHRMWGRALGLVFLLPCGYFAARGYFSRKLGITLAVLGGMGAGQGLVGWWMVKSGLEEPQSEHVVPRVSPYRLAAHLASAFLIYSGLFWTALNVAFPSYSFETMAQLKGAAKLRPSAHFLASLVGITALSGAFVAGNDAGRAYNTFPKMGDEWIPSTIFELQPFIRNFFENTATVQLNHRILALTSATGATSLWLASRSLHLTPKTRLFVNAALGMTVLQATLGITTLLTYVPVSLGSAHQAGALTLFTVLLGLLHTLRKPSPNAISAMSKAVKL